MNASPPTVLMEIPTAAGTFYGALEIPANARNLIVFAHGLTSSNLSPRNRLVARALHHQGFAVMLPDLTAEAAGTAAPAPCDDGERIFLTAKQLIAIIDWLTANPATRRLRIGLFGASTGAAAVMIAAALRPAQVHAVVSRGGRPDLADDLLAEVLAPTLMLVGSNDKAGITHNRSAGAKMRRKPMLELIHGASHLFGEPGKLERVACISSLWFRTTLQRCA
jgi:putative phosphoribosyl transferase